MPAAAQTVTTAALAAAVAGYPAVAAAVARHADGDFTLDRDGHHPGRHDLFLDRRRVAHHAGGLVRRHLVLVDRVALFLRLRDRLVRRDLGRLVALDHL